MTERVRRPLGALVPVYLAVFLFVVGGSALQVLMPVYLQRQASVGPTGIGVIMAMVGVAALAARLPVGLAYSAARGRRFMLAGGALTAAAFALVPFVHDGLLLGALMAVNGLGWSIATTTQMALLVARPPGGVTTAVAMGWFSGATAFGNMAAGALGGGVADLAGLRTTFFLLAATPLVGAALTARASAKASAAAGEPPAAVDRRPRPRLRELTRMPLAVWTGVLVMFFINAMNAITNTFQPLLALGAGLSLTQIGALSSIRSWASSFSRFGSGPLFGRLDAAVLTLPLVVAGAAATAAIPAVIASFALQVPLFALAGLSRGLLRVTGSADAFDAVGDDEARHGLVSAYLYGGLDLGKVVAPVIGGLVAGVVGISTMLAAVPLGFLALYLVLAVAARRPFTAVP